MACDTLPFLHVACVNTACMYVCVCLPVCSGLSGIDHAVIVN